MSRKGLTPVTLLMIFMLTGCGLFVPEIRDFPNGGSYASNNALVQAIVRSIHCELEDAVTKVLNAKANGAFDALFLRRWGAEVALTIQLEEKSTANPNAVWMPISPPTSIFALSGTFTGSADATRIDKVNFYYKVSDLYLGPNGKCQRDTTAPTDSLLIQSDLKLAEWLDVMVNGVATGQITSIANQNVLSHEVTFEIDTSGSITPAWKLVRATFNQSGNFLTGLRNRKHDLIITFAPLDKTQSGAFLIPIGESTHIASQIINGITTGFNSTLVGQ
jgi:hypothetical protein